MSEEVREKYKTYVENLKDMIIKLTSMNEVVKVLLTFIRQFKHTNLRKQVFYLILSHKSEVLSRNGK